MKKSFLFGSIIASIALFSGCGGSSGADADTTPPEITNINYSFDVNERTDRSEPLTANETGVTFTEDSDQAAINGSNLVFYAPNFNSSGENSYTVNVIATDEAGNESETKAFTFNVKAVITESYKFNSSYVASTGDKVFTPVDGNLKDPSGLLWDDKVSASMSYDAAKTYCKEKGSGWRMPTRAEFLNVLDYSKVEGTGSLIDSDFINYSDDAVTVSWVENLTEEKYVVHHADGTDSMLGNDMNHTVLCVYGDKNSSVHTFVQVDSDWKDNTTGLTWTKINTITPSTYDDAKSGCTTARGRLPTINELRSIIDYETNTITSSIAQAGASEGNYRIWSNTPARDTEDGNKTHYTIYLDGENQKAGVLSDVNTMTHYYTCVK